MADRSPLFTLLKPLHRRVAALYPRLATELTVLRTLLARERRANRVVDLPLRRRLWLWRRGFTSRSDALFDLDDATAHEYLSDRQHELANDVCEPWGSAVDNKLTFHLLFGAFPDHLPALYGVVSGGTLRRDVPLLAPPPWEQASATADGGVDVDGAVTTVSDATAHADRAAADSVATDSAATDCDATEWLTRYLTHRAALVLKPIYGQGGRGVLVCRRGSDGGYRVNGERYSASAFDALVADLDGYLVSAFVEQADYAAELFSGAANTLRVITLWDPDTDEPFVAGAVHRIGTDTSAPVDNWSRGGLSALVSETGELGSGAQWLPDQGTVRWYDTHPDTGAAIAGTVVPDWPAVHERLLDLAAAFPTLPRLGWDVLLTGDGGFVVLEVNAHAGTRTLQVHRPLLRDPRVRRFYEAHGCL